MKNMVKNNFLKRAACLAMSVVAVLSLSVGAFAAGSYSTTRNGNTSTDSAVVDSTEASAIFDTSKKGSISIFKYDITNAEKDGAWDSSYVSTGQYLDDNAAEADRDAVPNPYDVNGTVTQRSDIEGYLGQEAVPAGADGVTQVLGNGQESRGYAIKGVVFTRAQIGEPIEYSYVDATSGQEVIQLLYKIPRELMDSNVQIKMNGVDTQVSLASILGITPTTAAYKTDATYYYFQSDMLIDAFNKLLEETDTASRAVQDQIEDGGADKIINSSTYNASVIKSMLEQWVVEMISKNKLATYLNTDGIANSYQSNSGDFLETNEYGFTKAENLHLGLYLVVETKVPEMVTDTCIPFLVSLPMTNVDGGGREGSEFDAVTNGGTNWLYNVTVYPKNLTGFPSLEKTAREDAESTGGPVNAGVKSSNMEYATVADPDDDTVYTEDIRTFSHNVTASSNDVIEFQILSTMPAITSQSTYLSEYTFVDTLSKGLTYNQDSLKIEFYSDAACTHLVDTWTPGTNFTVTYTDSASITGGKTMTITMTDAGLLELNTNTKVYDSATRINSGYSDCTMRIVYTATLDADSSTVLGDAGNDNAVVLTWKRTSSNYFDTLTDDCHVYTYGIDLSKQFSGVYNKEMYDDVKFILHNDTDGYYVVATLDPTTKIYYVTNFLFDTETQYINENTGNSGGVASGLLGKVLSPESAGTTDGRIDSATKIAALETANAVFSPKVADPDDTTGSWNSLIIRGLEPDVYTLTEVATANGYTLLKDSIVITIATDLTDEYCNIYDAKNDNNADGSDTISGRADDHGHDSRGTVQNDPRRVYNETAYASLSTHDFFGNTVTSTTNDLNRNNRVVQESQTQLDHQKLTATSYVTIGNKTSNYGDAEGTTSDNTALVTMLKDAVKYGASGEEYAVTSNTDDAYNTTTGYNKGTLTHAANENKTSENGLVPLTIVNTRGFTLPRTGEAGNWMFPAVGISVACIAAFVIFMAFKKKEEKEDPSQA